jgi:Fe-S cluster biosynthesis and repair protein YggX
MGSEGKAARTVFCVKFQKELPGLDEVPFEGHPLGQRIYENVSKEAWKLWVERMKMILNEYRLNLGTPQAQEFCWPRWRSISSVRERGFRRISSLRSLDPFQLLAK